MASKKLVTICVCGCFGALFLIAGFVLLHMFTVVIHNEVDSSIPLKAGSESFKNWQKPSTPIYFQVWFWDIVNIDEVLQGGKPAVLQIGPYSYRETREKVDIKFFDNGTVTYRENRFFRFDREMSVGPETDTFHTVNLPMLTIMSDLGAEYNILKRIADLALEVFKESLFIELSVGDLLWGYEDPIFKALHDLAKPFNVSIPAKFGLFYNTNGSDDGVYEIYSGQKGVDKFGEIVTWNGMEQLNYWTSDLANKINGSDGTIYPPFIDTGKTKYLFSSDLCRSLGMDYTEGVTNRGIKMDRFVAPEILFANHTVNPYNQGFCDPKCLPSGLLYVGKCKAGAPIVMSMPHCLGCDAATLDSIRGWHPNQEEHQSFIDLEPMSGVVMNAGKRLQINVFMEKIEGFKETEHFKQMYMPIMWLNESALIDKSDASKFRSEVYGKVKLTDAVKYCLIAVGAFILICVLAVVVKWRMCTSQQDSGKIINDDDPLLIPNDGVRA